jgi:hypothetical protein
MRGLFLLPRHMQIRFQMTRLARAAVRFTGCLDSHGCWALPVARITYSPTSLKVHRNVSRGRMPSYSAR